MDALRRFGLFVAYVQLFLYTAIIVYCVLELNTTHYDTDKILPNDLSQLQKPPVKPVPPEIYPLLAVAVLSMFTAILLVYGITENREEFIFPWIPFSIFAALIYFAIGFFKLMQQPPFSTVGLLLLILYTTASLFTVYLIYLLYKDTEDRNLPDCP